MSRATIKRIPGQQGLASTEVAPTCGLHLNWISNTSAIDLSGATASAALLVAPGPGRIHKVVATYATETVSADGDGEILCGSISGATTDTDKFAEAIPTVGAVVGDTQDITLTSTVTFAKGEVILF